MDIRTELRELMETNNYSIAFVSTATGIAKSTISMWLNGNYTGKNDKITDAMNNFIKVRNIDIQVKANTKAVRHKNEDIVKLILLLLHVMLQK